MKNALPNPDFHKKYNDMKTNELQKVTAPKRQFLAGFGNVWHDLTVAPDNEYQNSFPLLEQGEGQGWGIKVTPK
jgi:hypothetical protein